jgi:glyoxylase-like metal-dependent hydrolase (beta-lactamase superfamily II)
MNLLEQRLHYPLGDALPAPGAATTLLPGVKWLRMPLPFALDHINLWLLRDSVDQGSGPVDGWTVVDCGVSNPALMAHWEAIFNDHLEGLPIVKVVVTHMHPDHIGLAWWLCERWKVMLHISATDYLQARMGTELKSSFGGKRAATFFASHGMTDPSHLAQLRAREGYYVGLVPQVPNQFVRLMEGQTFNVGPTGDKKTWYCISGFGHAPEHMALHCPEAGLLISGDMVLPRISTNVSVYESEPESNPLKLFLDSIQKFNACDPDTLVLPSHGKPFIGLHERVNQLQAHHDERLAELLQACTDRPMTALSALPVLFKRPLDFHQTTFALGESIAHLHWLWQEGQVRRERDTEGVNWFAVSP